MTIYPEDVQVLVDAGISLHDALMSAGVSVELPCGGNGTCGKCKVRFLKGTPRTTSAEVSHLTDSERESGWRLACQHLVDHDAEVLVPIRSRWVPTKDFTLKLPSNIEPRLQNVEVSCKALASLEISEICSDIEQQLIRTGIADCQWLPSAKDDLAVLSPHESHRCVVTLFDEWIVRVQRAGESQKPALGLALDIGTTIMAAGVVDLRDGQLLAADFAPNSQLTYGSDVIARIHYANQSPNCRTELESTLRNDVIVLVNKLINDRAFHITDVVATVVVGNPTMLHMFYGEDVRSLGTAPYRGRWEGARLQPAISVGLSAIPRAVLATPPMIRSHVGADIVAACVASGIDSVQSPALLLDLGTNCEVVLTDGQTLWVASAPAGPAFEGGNIRCGMRADQGAIDHVALRPDQSLLIHTIGAGPARGICGAGLVDALAILLEIGVLDGGGYLKPQSDAPSGVRLRAASDQPGQYECVLYDGTGHLVVLTQGDIRALQFAKASIRAAVDTLLHASGISASHLSQVFLSGVFGSHVRPRSLLRIGLLPKVPPESIVTVGNAAGAGAVLALCDKRAWARCQNIATSAHYVELAGQAFFDERFLENLTFPEA